jgi:hypothetical protein
MKTKTFFAIAIAIFAAGAASAQENTIDGEDQRWEVERKRDLANASFNNFSYATQRMTEPVTGIRSETSDWGAAFTKGRTFALHYRPVGRVLYFGLDAIWSDINYAQYSIAGDSSAKLHQADVSVGAGPSVHILPVGRLGIHTYFRYLPTYGLCMDEDMIMGGFASMFTTGAAVSWSAISLGAETRWGTGDYKLISPIDGEEGGDDIGGKLKTSGMRFYLSLRF